MWQTVARMSGFKCIYSTLYPDCQRLEETVDIQIFLAYNWWHTNISCCIQLVTYKYCLLHTTCDIQVFLVAYKWWHTSIACCIQVASDDIQLFLVAYKWWHTNISFCIQLMTYKLLNTTVLSTVNTSDDS